MAGDLFVKSRTSREEIGFAKQLKFFFPPNQKELFRMSKNIENNRKKGDKNDSFDFIKTNRGHWEKELIKKRFGLKFFALVLLFALL